MSLKLLLRQFSSKTTNFKSFPKLNAAYNAASVQSVALSKDETTFVAWHPKIKDFPYEFSKPIPTVQEQQSASLLKDKSVQTALNAFKNKHPEVARQELMKITHTTKHRWYPRARDKKAKKTPMDRPFL